jgi:hypothetical protein
VDCRKVGGRKGEKHLQPGERVEEAPQHEAQGGLLMGGAEMLLADAANSDLAFLLGEPTSRFRVRGEGEEEDDSEEGGDHALHREDLLPCV